MFLNEEMALPICHLDFMDRLLTGLWKMSVPLKKA